MMRRIAQIGWFMSSGFLLSGCWSQPMNQDLERVQLQLTSIEQRIDQLETVRDGSSNARLAQTTAESMPTKDTGSSEPARQTERWFHAGGAVTKLGRGGVNLVTGWVEIPKRMIETSQRSGAGAGWTWGLLRGLGHGFIRTLGGFYEIVTFPFPAPPGYVSVIQPEYVFTNEPDDSSHN